MPILLILVGLVGSGKSALAQSLTTQLTDWTRVCQDDLGDRRSCEARVQRALQQGRNVVVDRVNFDEQQRAHFLRLAGPGVEKWCIVMDIPQPVLAARLNARTSHPTLHSPQQALQVLDRMSRVYRPPIPEREGFERIYQLLASEQPLEWDMQSLEGLLKRVASGRRYSRNPATPPFAHGGSAHYSRGPRDAWSGRGRGAQSGNWRQARQPWVPPGPMGGQPTVDAPPTLPSASHYAGR